MSKKIKIEGVFEGVFDDSGSMAEIKDVILSWDNHKGKIILYIILILLSLFETINYAINIKSTSEDKKEADDRPTISYTIILTLFFLLTVYFLTTIMGNYKYLLKAGEGGIVKVFTTLLDFTLSDSKYEALVIFIICILIILFTLKIAISDDNYEILGGGQSRWFQTLCTIIYAILFYKRARASL